MTIKQLHKAFWYSRPIFQFSFRARPPLQALPRQHLLYFFPLPQGHGSLRPILTPRFAWTDLAIVSKSFVDFATGDRLATDAGFDGSRSGSLKAAHHSISETASRVSAYWSRTAGARCSLRASRASSSK